MDRHIPEPINRRNFFLFTGGPGSGKTSVLNELNKQGYSIVPEVARKIIKAQRALGGNATHTGNRISFRDLMLKQSIEDFKKMMPSQQLVFFDRGIPDLYGYSQRFCGQNNVEVDQAIQHYRYNKMVFIFPPWSEIYTHDKERQQTLLEAEETYEAVKAAHIVSDYVLMEMPKISVVERVNFILKRLKSAGND